MRIGCPVGHPSGPGRHCPLCGRAYVRLEELESFFAMPAPREAMDNDVVQPAVLQDADAPRIEVEALAMLSSLASDFDY